MLVRPVGRHVMLAGAMPSKAWKVVVADVVGDVAYLVAVRATGAVG